MTYPGYSKEYMASKPPFHAERAMAGGFALSDRIDWEDNGLPAAVHYGAYFFL